MFGQLTKPNIVAFSVNQLRPVPIAVPPAWFEEGCGYRGTERYLAFYVGDNILYLEDGATWRPAVYQAFWLWHDTPGMTDLMAGTGIKTCKNWFLLDRLNRTGWISTRESILQPILMAQKPPFGGHPTGSPGWEHIKIEFSTKIINWWIEAGYIKNVIRN